MHLLVKCKHALHFVHCTWYMISRLRASILIGFFVSSQLSCSHRSTQPLDETSCSSVMRFNLKHFHSLHSIFCSVHFFHMLILNARENGMQQTHTYTSIRTEKKMEIYIKYSQQIKGESFLVHDGAHFPIYLFGKYWVCWNDSLASLRAFHFPLAKFSIPFALSALNCKYCIEWA